MKLSQVIRSRHVLVAVIGAVLSACADQNPTTPVRQATMTPQPAVVSANEATAAATLRMVTARYQDLQTALDDQFVLLHECESRPGEGPVGTVYLNVARLLDGVIDPKLPDALIYAPSSNGSLKLAGAEFAIPYALAPQRPSFLGHAFQDEPEFGVYALHAWVWLENPNGMFEETNPRITCGA